MTDKTKKNIPPDLTHVHDWIFDLDKTLYSSGLGLFSQIESRMCSFIAERFDMEHDEAWALQKHCYSTYGTTLQGLIRTRELEKRGMVADDFLNYVHNIDYSVLTRNENLRAGLERLPGRRFVFTNGIKEHADRVVHQLGIADLFDGIFDIRDSHYISKPDIDAFHKMTAEYKIDPYQAAFFEDSHKNLKTAERMGMATIWIREETNLEIGQHLKVPSYCQYVTDSLSDWLHSVIVTEAAPVKKGQEEK